MTKVGSSKSIKTQHLIESEGKSKQVCKRRSSEKGSKSVNLGIYMY